MARAIKTSLLLVCCFCCLSLADPPVVNPDRQSKLTVDVLFSPGDPCTERIVEELAGARQTIRVQAYSFTSAPIAKAIVDARKRGVDCEAVLDKSQRTENYSELDFLYNQGVPAYVDDRHAIAHNKIILVDGSTVITGSFNFTKAAEESNAENLLILKGDASLAAKYAANYTKHREHSTKYEGRNSTAGVPGGPSQTVGTDDPIVYVTKSGSKYHTAGCSSLGKSSIPLKLSEAVKRYQPCSRCHPPTTQAAAAESGGDSAKAKKSDSSSTGSGGQCTATTKKGTRCKRTARSNGRCWQHGG